jgi:DNA-binding transcriptional LysR family regulator
MDRLAAMEAFVLVVETGSFSAAARRLNVGQPAVSKLVAQLEDRLGVKLLVRTTRGLTATEAGLNYCERARRSIDEADEAEFAARGAGSGLTGRLRICAAVTFARIHLMPRIPELLARHPELEMEIVLDDRNIDLVQEGIDVALRMGRLADSTLTARRIASGRQVVLGSSTYFARVGEPAAPGVIAYEAVIYALKGGGVDWTLQREGAEIAVTLKGRLRVSAAEGVRAAVLANAGIAITSEWMFAPEIADGTVISCSTTLDLFDVGQEVGSIHRAIQHKRGRDAIIAQPAYKSRCFPVAVWHLINEPFALRSPAIEAGQLGGGGGLIDEDKLFRI